MIAGFKPPTNTFPTMRLWSPPTSTTMPAFAPTMRLKAKVFRREPSPSCHHSTLIPASASTIRLRAISDLCVECSM